jgi:GAF domain-containing protein
MARPGDPPERRGQPSGQFSGQVPENLLAERLGLVARSLWAESGLEETLRGIVGAALRMVPGARFAGLSTIERRRRIVTRSATDDRVYAIDLAQYESGEGPCLDAVREQRTVRLSDMATETRWPMFTRAAQELGIASMLSIQLYMREGNLGALNLYSPMPHAFDDESEQVGLLLATHAAVAMAGARTEQELDLALAARDLIGQAKGILMERHKLSAAEAFRMLVRASQQTNRKLAEVARDLAETGELPGPGRQI